MTVRVLVVEDNQMAARMAKLLLQQSIQDVEIDIINNGEDAVKAYQSAVYDLILMDIGLGDGIDGAEATSRIRKLEHVKELSPCPIVAVTAQASINDRLNLTKVGMNEIFEKPLDKDKITKLINNYLNKQSS